MRWFPSDAVAWKTLIVSAGFELGLGVVAFVIGKFIGIDVFQGAALSFQAIGLGALAALPMILVLLILIRFPPKGFRDLEDQMRQWSQVFIAPTGIFGLLILSFAAGIGEEILTRGLIHSWISIHTPTWVALVITGAIFGLLHPISKTYILIAGIVGVYLGWIWLLSGQNVVAPAIAHAFYDFVALVILVRAPSRHSPPLED